MEYLICSIAVLLFLYLIIFSYKNHSPMNSEESWWPWKLTPYNEWPYWLGGKPSRVPTTVPPSTSSKPVVHTRPWGGDSRLANAI
jgi:hypothetical protein